MIVDKEAIYERIRNFQWLGSDLTIDQRVVMMDRVIAVAMLDTCKQVGALHLAFSGGLDSAVLLFRTTLLGLPLVAHTVASTNDHPDIVYAKEALTQTATPGRQHIVSWGQAEVDLSNKILGVNQDHPDMYLLLLRELAKVITDVVCGDCIDEMMGGYYRHQSGELADFQYFMDRLIPDHLEPLDKISSYFGIDVYLPYTHPAVMAVCQKFLPRELADASGRKIVMVEVGEFCGVPRAIRERRKYGLISICDPYLSSTTVM